MSHRPHRRGLLKLLRVVCAFLLVVQGGCDAGPSANSDVPVASGVLSQSSSYDPIYAAIQQIQGDCPWLAEALGTMLSNGDIYFTDVQGTYGDIAYAFFDGPILLDSQYYSSLGSPEEILAQLVPDLIHESGHAIGHHYDDPGVCCPNQNPYDQSGCPQPPSP